MTENTTDLREFVHERFRKTDEKLDRLLAEMSTVGRRLTSIENRITSLDHSVAHVHERIDVMQKQLDDVGQRLSRIEKHADLYKEKA